MFQTVNDQIVMYNWNTNAYKQVNFATFFQDSASFIFDPRVIWDPYWDRFVVLALVDNCSSCNANSPNKLYLATSKANDPTGAWWIYQTTLSNQGYLADFPQLGMDLHAIVVTTNLDTSGEVIIALIFAVDKAYLYNGLQFTIQSYESAASCSTAPPYVLDNNAADYFLTFCPGDSKVLVQSLSHPGSSDEAFASVGVVNVTYAGLPADAVQPGVDYPLDTGDNRFENRSLQVGNRVINTATVNVRGATPAFFSFSPPRALSPWSSIASFMRRRPPMTGTRASSQTRSARSSSSARCSSPG
jgi:hypothetical protein